MRVLTDDPPPAKRERSILDQNQERWAEALFVVSQYGDDATTFIAERLAALTARGDPAGVARWEAIAQRVTMLREARPDAPSDCH